MHGGESCFTGARSVQIDIDSCDKFIDDVNLLVGPFASSSAMLSLSIDSQADTTQSLIDLFLFIKFAKFSQDIS